jgi:hypothetical protein
MEINFKPANNSSKSKESKEKDEGLSTPLIIGISLGGFTLIAGGIGLVIFLQSGSSKPRRKKKPLRKRIDYDDEDD